MYNFLDFISELLETYSRMIVAGLVGVSIITLLWGKIVTPKRLLTRKKAKVDKQLEKLKRKANAILKTKYGDPMRFILSFCYLAFSIAFAFGVFYLLVIWKGF